MGLTAGVRALMHGSRSTRYEGAEQRRGRTDVPVAVWGGIWPATPGARTPWRYRRPSTERRPTLPALPGDRAPSSGWFGMIRAAPFAAPTHNDHEGRQLLDAGRQRTLGDRAWWRRRIRPTRLAGRHATLGSGPSAQRSRPDTGSWSQHRIQAKVAPRAKDSPRRTRLRVHGGICLQSQPPTASRGGAAEDYCSKHDYPAAPRHVPRPVPLDS